MSVDHSRSVSGTFFAHYILGGLIGSVLVFIGSLGVGWLPVNTGMYSNVFVQALREPGIGLALSRFCVIAGVALILQAWLVLGFDILHGRTIRVTDLYWTLAAWTAPLLLAPPLFSRDAYAYFTQGKLLISGRSPYEYGVSTEPGWFNDGADPIWAESPTPYGPLFLMIERGVAQFVGPHPVWAVIAFRLWAVAAVAVLAVAVPALANRHGVDPGKALWIAVLNPLVFMHFVAGAHNDALMVAAIVVALLWTLDFHPWAGMLAMAVAVSLKPVAVLALPFLGLIWAGVRSSWWTRIRAWLVSGAVVAAVVIFLGWVSGTGLGWVSALSTPGAIRTWLSPPTALGMLLNGASSVIGLGNHMDQLVGISRALATVAALLAVAWLVLKPEGRPAVRGAALALLAVVVLGPVVQPWYLLWSLPLLAATGLSGKWLRVILLGSAMLTLHGVAGSSATSDALLEFSDGFGLLLIAGLLALVVAASPRERQLLIGDRKARGIRPDDPPAEARYRQTVMQPATSWR